MKANDPAQGNGLLRLGGGARRERQPTPGWNSREPISPSRPNNIDEKSSFSRNAGSTAFIAYQRAKTPSLKAAALAALAASYEARSLWRPAIEAYKESLAQQDDTDVRASFDQAIAEHGFRMLDYTTDSDSASPRICMQFSETLAHGPSGFREIRLGEWRGPGRRPRAEFAALHRGIAAWPALSDQNPRRAAVGGRRKSRQAYRSDRLCA